MVSAPLRSCVACRAIRPKRELVRVHLGPGGALEVDLSGEAGRGAYLCPQSSCLEQALKRGGIARTLKATLAPIGVAALEELIRARICRKVVALLGLARRARKVASGAEAVESAVKRHSARLVLIAADASANSVARCRTLAVQGGVAWRQGLGKEELGAALGGAPRACVAVTDSHFAEAMISVLAKMPGQTEAGEASRSADRSRGQRATLEGLGVIERGND